MKKDTDEQFFSRVCREYTLPRSDESSQPKGWIQGNTVKNIFPMQQNSMKKGYDENKAYGKSDENECATNYSIITNNNKWNDTHNNMQLTMHNKYTNDDVDSDDCVVHTVR